MAKIIKLTESELVKIVKRVISEGETLTEGALSSPSVPSYKVISSNGWLKDSNGEYMCVKVVTGSKTFAQGISNIKGDGNGAIIYPNDAMWGFGELDMTKDEVANVLKALKAGQTSKTVKTGATIYIGKALVPWCKSQWKS